MHARGEAPTEENTVEAPLSDVELCDACAMRLAGRERVHHLVPESVFKLIDDGMAAKGHRPLDHETAELIMRPVLQ